MLERLPFVMAERSKAALLQAGETEEERYHRLIGDQLSGLSDLEQPLRAAVFAQVLEDIEAGLSEKGMRKYSPLLRESFNSNIIVDDADDIPKKKRCQVRMPCGIAHPGLCPQKTPAIFHSGVYLGICVRDTCR